MAKRIFPFFLFRALFLLCNPSGKGSLCSYYLRLNYIRWAAYKA